jgi:anthranilate phosphoribosyltransferase
MTVDFKHLLGKIAEGTSLSQQEANSAFSYMMSGDATGPQIGAFLMGLRLRGETIDEITGAAEVMRAKATKINAPEESIDTCGTGGDGSHTYNISTASAIVMAACGLSVAKHGNRAVSSKSGSADVLETLGINIEAEHELVEKCIKEIGIGFLMATRHHSAMRHVGPARASLGLRTIYNLIGPLSNPAGTKRQVIGVFDKKWCEPLAKVLGKLGSKHVWVVHGSDGLDELTITGKSYVSEFKDGAVRNFEISPEDAGLPLHDMSELKGGDAEYNAAALRAILNGEENAYLDIVLLNSAAALIVAGKTDNLKEGVRIAKAAIHDGKAAKTLEKWIKMSNE